MLFTYITRLASKEISSPSGKIHREVGRAEKEKGETNLKEVTGLSVASNLLVRKSTL